MSERRGSYTCSICAQVHSYGYGCEPDKVKMLLYEPTLGSLAIQLTRIENELAEIKRLLTKEA